MRGKRKQTIIVVGNTNPRPEFQVKIWCECGAEHAEHSSQNGDECPVRKGSFRGVRITVR